MKTSRPAAQKCGEDCQIKPSRNECTASVTIYYYCLTLYKTKLVARGKYNITVSSVHPTLDTGVGGKLDKWKHYKWKSRDNFPSAIVLCIFVRIRVYVCVGISTMYTNGKRLAK